jgi:hypothetical protein
MFLLKNSSVYGSLRSLLGSKISLRNFEIKGFKADRIKKFSKIFTKLKKHEIEATDQKFFFFKIKKDNIPI